MTAEPLPLPPDGARLSPVELMEVRDRLVDAGLGDAAMDPSSAIAAVELDAARRPQVLAELRMRDDPAAVLARVFTYGDTALPSELEDAVGATTLDRLAACNLLGRTESGRLGCPVVLRPLAGVLIASDPSGCAGEAVMTPGLTTAGLTRALPQPPLGRVLDVGTGSGVLALLAARTGATVTATDLTERACTFTRFNAAFNGVEVRVRRGDVFEPVAEEQFDLVVSQPPFVVQPPDLEPTSYMHGGPSGDEVALRVLGGLGDVLAPGASALVRFDAPGSLDSVARRVRGVVPDAFDLAVFGFPALGADMIARGYAALADPSFGRCYRDLVARYERHMAGLGLDHFIGTLTLVRRPGAAHPGTTLAAAGRTTPEWPFMMARLSAAQQASDADSALLLARLAPMPGARLSAELDLDRAGQHPSFVIRYPRDPVANDMEMNEAGAALLQLFSGGRDVAAVVDAFAAASGRSVEEAEADVVAFARDALWRGLLVPVSSDA